MIKMKRKNFIMLMVGIIVSTMVVTATCGYMYTRFISKKVVLDRDTYLNVAAFATKYNKLYQLDNTIERNFLWEVDDEAMMNAIFKAAVDSLGDKYSLYMTKEESQQWENYMSGEYSGIGITFTMEESGDYRIVRVLDNSPADEAGIREGDYVLSVNGKKIKDFEKMGEAMRGEKGTKVTLKYERNGKIKEATLTRASLTLSSVYAGEVDNGIGYLAITSFDKNTGKEFTTELKNMEQKGIKGLIIDIRGNGGGYVKQGVEVADALLPECTITYTENKKGEKKYYNSDSSSTTIPYVLLVNGSSASTSEIVAAAIKDNKGGPLVGSNTFGKGIVQGAYGFKDGSSVKLTIMEYFSPEGNKIHKKGIEPDYQVSLKKGDTIDFQLEKAIELLEQ